GLLVVELAVQRGPDATVLRADRLSAEDRVHDAQATRTDRDPVGGEGPAVVGTAMVHRVGQDRERVFVRDGTRTPAQLDDPTDAAHLSRFSGRVPRRRAWAVHAAAVCRVCTSVPRGPRSRALGAR